MAGKRYGAENNIRMIIYYYEKLDHDWGYADKLTLDQKEALDYFLYNRDRDYQIVENVTIPPEP